MAWKCSGGTNNELLTNLFNNKLITSTLVLNSMKLVDRKNFVLTSDIKYAYFDEPLSIGYDATISAPHMHAMCLELFMNHFNKVNDQNSINVLDVGSGSGYLVAVLAHLVGNNGKVYGIEHIPELVKLSIENINKEESLIKSLENGKILIVEADGRKGLPEYAPFDCIHVGAAAPTMPEELMKQLKIGGRLVVPVGKSGYNQILYSIDRISENEFDKKVITGVMYVPLTDKKI